MREERKRAILAYFKDCFEEIATVSDEIMDMIQECVRDGYDQDEVEDVLGESLDEFTDVLEEKYAERFSK